MIVFYKKSLLDLLHKLKELTHNPNDLNLLLEIQSTLIKKIRYIENCILKLNQENKVINRSLSQNRFLKSESKKLKDKRELIKAKKEEYIWLIFVYKCIGDGIVFSYLDKWDIKPLSFKDKSIGYKESTGFISGKTGLIVEQKILKFAIEQGIPSILSDLTNCIRHGDICLMHDSLPRLIEIKSSKNKSDRISRQTDGIRNVESYLRTDKAMGLRGFSSLQRVNIHSPEINYVAILNELIENAFKNGFSCREVEPGILYYVQLSDTDLKNLQECSNKIITPIFYYLNTLKNESQWINYYPFTLSIDKPKNIYEFLCGEIQIIVLIDFDVIKDYAQKKGFEANILNKLDITNLIESYTNRGIKFPYTDYEVSILVDNAILFRDPNLELPEGSLIMSFEYMSRAAYEFTSLFWLLDQGFLQYKKFFQE